MKRVNDGSKILLIIISIAILFVSLIGITFAYFTVNIEVIGSQKSTLIESTTLIVEYARTNDIYYDNLIPGRPEQDENSQYKNKLTFTLTSPTNLLVKTVYDIYLNIEQNDFITNNLVFYLKENECFRTDGTGSSQGTLQSYEYENYDDEGETIILGVIPAEKKGKYKISENAVLGGLGCEDSWDFEIWLKELGVEQNEDQSRTFKATIEIETKEILPIEGFTKEDVEEYQKKLEEEKAQKEQEEKENKDENSNNKDDEENEQEDILNKEEDTNQTN